MTTIPFEAMAFILAVWSLMSLIFMGLGSLASSIFNVKDMSAGAYFRSFWIGWSFTIFFLQIWHLFLPVDVRAFCAVYAGAVIGATMQRKRIFADLRHHAHDGILFTVILFLPVLLMANRAIALPMSLDTRVYHLQTVMWNESFSIVPGLGNLHHRLAFNSTHFLYVAFLDVFDHHGPNLANGLLLSVFLSQVIYSFFKLWSRPFHDSLYHFLISLYFVPISCLIFLSTWHGMGGVSSPTNDLPNEILTMLISAELVWMIIRDRLSFSPGQAEAKLFYISVLACAGITIKLSMLAFSTVAVSTAIIVFLYQYRKDNTWKMISIFSRVLLCAVMAFVPWIIRNIILSGYPFYPSLRFPIDVEWRMPPQTVAWNLRWDLLGVAGSGNMWTHWNAKNPALFIHWLKHTWIPNGFFQDQEMCIILILFSIGCLTATMLWLIGKMPKNKMLLGFLPAVVSIIYCLLTAPVVRYVEGSFWVIGIGIFVFAVSNIVDHRIVSVICASICVGYLLFFCMMKGGLVSRQDGRMGFYNYPRTKEIKIQLEHGPVVSVAQKEGKNPLGCCWEEPLPCTPALSPGLALIKTDRMGAGFKINKHFRALP